MVNQIKRFLHLLDQHQSFLILMHERPDGDTIACSLALAEGLRQLGKSVSCVSKDPIPQPFRFLPGIETISHDFLTGDFEVMVVIDCGDLRRTGFPARVRQFAQQQKKLVHIDHHQKSDLYKLANIKIFDASASATGQILYHIFQLLPLTLTNDIATCLLTSLYYDTGAFKHANTTNEILGLAAQLLHQGARLKEITQHVELTKSVETLKLWGIALARAKKNESLGIVSSIVTQADLKALGAEEEGVAGLVNLLNTVPGTKVALLLYETVDGTLRASLRTEDNRVDVAKLASYFGGGGLKRASGFSLPGSVVLDDNNWRIQLATN